MDIEILDQGAFESALVRLEPGESFVSEAGAMYRASGNVDIDVTTRSRSGGGLLSGVKRMFAGESFFLSTYQTNDNGPGEVGLAPTHLGGVAVLDVEPSTNWICAGGSYLGSDAGLDVDTQFQGLKGFFTGESLSFVKVSGQGHLLVTAFGRLIETEVRDALTVDTGHVVAFEDSLEYTPGKIGGSWIQSWLGGEGVVLHFSGHGRLIMQSHNPTEFGRYLGRLLPPRSS